MQDNAGHILKNSAKKNRTLKDNEGQILKLRTMQDYIQHVQVKRQKNKQKRLKRQLKTNKQIKNRAVQ